MQSRITCMFMRGINRSCSLLARNHVQGANFIAMLCAAELYCFFILYDTDVMDDLHAVARLLRSPSRQMV